MDTPSLIDRQHSLLQDLEQVRSEQLRSEPALARTFQAEMDEAEQDFEDRSEKLQKRQVEEIETLGEQLHRAEQQIEVRFLNEEEVAKKEHVRSKRDFAARLEAEQKAIDSKLQEGLWAADATLEAAMNEAKALLREKTAALASQLEELKTQRAQAEQQLRLWNYPAIDDEVEIEATPVEPRPDSLVPFIEQTQTRVQAIRSLVWPRYQGSRLVVIGVILFLSLIYPMGMLIVPQVKLPLLLAIGATASAILAVFISWILSMVLRSLALKGMTRQYDPLLLTLEQSRLTAKQLQTHYQHENDRAVADARQRHEREQAKARARHQQKMQDLEHRREVGFAPIDERLQSQLLTSEKQRDTDLKASQTKHDQAKTAIETQYGNSLKQLQTRYQQRTDDIQRRHMEQWRGLLTAWQELLTRARENIKTIREQMHHLFPAWDHPRWHTWEPASPAAGVSVADLVPPAVQYGTITVKVPGIEETPPWIKGRTDPVSKEVVLPAMCPFPEPGSILYHTTDEGRDRAVESLQNIMLRILTTIPAGRVRFIIIDPVGLGQNFAAFMNLADHDEALVTGRIWTESTHIEQRLADLTAHMENVIQKYLRNRYPSINDYNQHAGEVAEPFRVLVVANFPQNFTAEATRRLISIAQSGPRCGVSLFLSIDTRQALPKGFDLADLERYQDGESAAGRRINLVWEHGVFHPRDEVLERYPLQLDRPPASEEFCNQLLLRIGEAARGAQRVEVPFEFIAPTSPQWWKGSTSQGISVALGRAGATRRQCLELGRGTSQHALVAGKTGSGKSTLLHALITNLALIYRPEEIELYLIDFKKGVEFKTYATHKLPHARVIAIESEREFGLSVLRRLDTELRLRGEQFRTFGAQDLHAFRQASPGTRMPRILLIVDEFQEFFVEDDRLAQEAAQLLDRLVRQGRAFGMHVLLGSQTLGGAYSLARSTIDQMAVRIALQCSEADAHLILSDENSAARLLSRPGEAIYNDANGLVEGNDPFQVVWLGDEQREQYLNQIHQLVETYHPECPTTVVFEGNASADPQKNPLLERLLSTPPAGADDYTQHGETAHLGEAMAIDELTTAVFRRQNSSNLVIVGQQSELALGMLTTSVISLAAHVAGGTVPDGTPRFYVIDGHQADAPRTGVATRLGEMFPTLVRTAGTRDLPTILTDLEAEVQRRQQDGDGAPSLYLVLYGLHRMRELRKQDDDFGYMSRGEDKPPTPDKQLATILREGASLGIHVLIWCDSLGNLQRALDRQAMREIAMRVVFQMNVTDSSNLIDSPAASKLGLHRALYVNEDDGKMEKFRPYGLPSDEYLTHVTQRLERRGGIPRRAGSESASEVSGRSALP